MEAILAAEGEARGQHGARRRWVGPAVQALSVEEQIATALGGCLEAQPGADDDAHLG